MSLKTIKTKNETINQKGKETKKNRKGKLGGNNMKNVSKLLTVGAGLMLTYTANAAGTAAGTSVTNQASVAFQVGGVSQTAINSNSEAFLVDRKVIFTVTSNGNENVSPGEAGQVLAYTINHTGNYTGDFSVAGSDAGGDDFNVSSFQVFVESGGGAGYQAGLDTATYVDELAADASIVVYIVSTIPSTPVNTDNATMYLTATARAGGVASTQGAVLSNDSGSADVAGTVQNVFADNDGINDGDKDGVSSDDGDYNVVAAVVTVSKTSSVISDGVSGSNFKRIPGAVVEYVITVSNDAGAGADATNIVVTDPIPANTTFADSNAYGGEDMEVGGIAEPAGAGGNGDHNVTTAGAVTGLLGTIAPGASKTVKFRVTVN